MHSYTTVVVFFNNYNSFLFVVMCIQACFSHRLAFQQILYRRKCLACYNLFHNRTVELYYFFLSSFDTDLKGDICINYFFGCLFNKIKSGSSLFLMNAHKKIPSNL